MNTIIFITGPSGSGKSTVAKELCRRFDKAIRVDIDRLKHLLSPGSLDYFYPDTKLGQQQWSICVKNINCVVNNFTTLDNFLIVIDGFLPTVVDYQQVINLSHVQHSFLLLPSMQVVYQRNKLRNSDRVSAESDITEHLEFFRSHQDQFANFTTVDTSSMTVNEVVTYIQDSISSKTT